MSNATKTRPAGAEHAPTGDEQDPKTGLSGRARVVIIVIAIVAVLVIAAAIIFNALAPGAKSTSSANSAKTGTSATNAAPARLTPIADTPMSKPRADAALKDYLGKVSTIGPKTKNLSNVLLNVASGPIVAELENTQQELTTEGWTLKGVPTVVSVKILKSNPSAAKPTATVEACIDSSKVFTYDSKGKVIPTAGGKAAARALNIYSLQRTDGHWRVVSRTFPNNPTC